MYDEKYSKKKPAAKKKVKAFAGGGAVTDDHGEDFPGGVNYEMYDRKARSESEERKSGKRFSDDGVNIPGKLAGKNQDYRKKMGMKD
jgi:hypothetical protein